MGNFGEILDWLPISKCQQPMDFPSANNLPKPDKPIFPDYYGDILQFAKIADIAKIKWVTKLIYLWLYQLGGLKHVEAKCWRHVREVQAEEIWKGTYTSYASGAPPGHTLTWSS